MMNYETVRGFIREERSDAAESAFKAGYLKALEMAMTEGLFDEDFPDLAYERVVKMADKRAEDFLIISGMR